MPLKTRTVRAGDTLSAIAQEFGVGISDITGFRSGDPDKIFTGENLQIDTGPVQPVNSINAADIGQGAFIPPPNVTKTGDRSLQGLAETTTSQIEDLKPKVEKGEEEIRDVFDQLGKQASKRAEQYRTEETAFGTVTQTQKELNDISNKIRQKEVAHRRRIEKIQEENPTGQLSSGQQIAIAKADREFAREAADLAIIAEVKLGNFSGAKGIIDDKINAETEDLTTRLAGLQFFFNKNFNQLSDAQKTLLKQETSLVEKDLAEKKELLSQIGDIQLEAAQNGAPAEVIMAIGRQDEVGAAIAAGGTFIGKLERDREARLAGDGDDKNVIDITPEDERILTGAGFNSTDINDIQRSVADFGVQATIDAMETDEEKAAIRKVYNIELKATVTRAQIDQLTTQKAAEDWIKDTFTKEEIIKMARDNGFARRRWSNEREAEEFLKSPKIKKIYADSLQKQYEAAGIFQK